VRDHRPTSQDTIRALTAARRDAVCASVARLLTGRLIQRERQRDPFTLTEAGVAALNGSRPQSSPVVPESSPGRVVESSPPSPPLGGRDDSTATRGA
jgi:hypothetical protein